MMSGRFGGFCSARGCVDAGGLCTINPRMPQAYNKALLPSGILRGVWRDRKIR